MAVKRFYFFGSYSSIEEEYLLDKFQNATVGYSLRKLRRDYTGHAIRVIRDSDNEYADIGFVGGSLDVSGLLSWLNGNTGLVHTWYFQGLPSEGIDAVQTVKANMPRIVHDGVIETLNGKPALNFMDNQFFDLGSDSRYHTGTTGAYGYVVASLRVLLKGHGLFGRSVGATNATRVSLHNSATSGLTSTRSNSVVSLPPPAVNTQAVMYQLITGTNNTVGLNGTTNTASPSSNFNQSGFHYFIGAYGNPSGTAPQAGLFLNGKMQELVQFYNDKSAVRFDIRDEINNYYGTY